MAFHE
jgi:Spy/CpxP family protein refolding chaperone